MRVPDLAVTCAPLEPGDRLLRELAVVIEVLSPSNRAETWQNVWSYATSQSVRESLVIYTAEVPIDLMRREPNDMWPDDPVALTSGDTVTLESVGFTVPVAALHRTA